MSNNVQSVGVDVFALRKRRTASKDKAAKGTCAGSARENGARPESHTDTHVLGGGGGGGGGGGLKGKRRAYSHWNARVERPEAPPVPVGQRWRRPPLPSSPLPKWAASLSLPLARLLKVKTFERARSQRGSRNCGPWRLRLRRRRAAAPKAKMRTDDGG